MKTNWIVLICIAVFAVTISSCNGNKKSDAEAQTVECCAETKADACCKKDSTACCKKDSTACCEKDKASCCEGKKEECPKEACCKDKKECPKK